VKCPKIPRKYLWGAGACAAVGAVLLFPGSVVMLAVGAVLGFQGRAWLEQTLGKEAMT